MWACFSALLSTGGLAGCSADVTYTQKLLAPPATTLGSLAISPLNAIVAVGGTQQFSVSMQSLTGAPITNADSVVYMLSNPADTVRLRIDRTTGVVTGVAPSTPPRHVRVNVFAYQGIVIVGDQAFVQVTTNAIANPTASIQPNWAAGDSVRLAMGVSKTVVPRIRNAAGDSVSSPAARFNVAAADMQRVAVFQPYVGLFDRSPYVYVTGLQYPSGGINRFLPKVDSGTAWIYYRAVAYGVPIADSVRYSFTPPFSAQITVTKTNLELTSAGEGGSANVALTLAAGAEVTFFNSLSGDDPLTITVEFSDPNGATTSVPAPSPGQAGGASGNITTLVGGQSAQRRFNTPGRYVWTMKGTGGPAPWNGQTVSGTLVIK